VWARLVLDVDRFFPANPSLAACRPLAEFTRDKLREGGVIGDEGFRSDCTNCAQKAAATYAASLGKKMAWFVSQAWQRGGHKETIQRELGSYVAKEFPEAKGKTIVMLYRSVTCAEPVRFVIREGA